MTTPADSLDALIHQVANAYALPVDVLRGQVQVESSGDPFAFRYEHAFFDRYVKDNPDAKAAKYGPLAACSLGLLQIMLETAVEDGFDGRPEDLFQARVGLAWGAKHLKALMVWAHDDIEQALAAYNAGKGNWQSPAGQSYATKVLKAAGRTV